MTAAIDITTGQRKTLLALLRRFIPGVEVWAYGSRVKWSARPNSDLDIVAFTSPGQRHLVSELKDAIGESNLPFLVDLHVWDEVPERFHEIIRKEHVVLQEIKQLEKSSGRGGGEWATTRLGQVATINPDAIGRDWSFPHIRYIDISSVKDGQIEIPPQWMKVSDAPSRAKRLVRKGDTVLSTVRPNRRSMFFAYQPGEDWVVSTGFAVLRPKTQIIDPRFLYTCVFNQAFTEYLITREKGAAYPAVSPEDIANAEVPLPPLKEQQAIACILGALDDKIELNRRMNETLEAMARAIFKSWFVEMAKETWERGRLENILESIESGSRPKGGIDPELKTGIPSIGAENINGLGYYNYSKTKFITEDFFDKMNRGIIGDYDVLIYKDGAYIGRKSMFGNGFPFEKCCVNEHVFILRGNKKINQFFLYFLLKQDELLQLNANSAQPGLNQESMKSYKIIIPTSEAIRRFGEMVKPCVDKIFFNCNESRTLAAIRDALSPKLLSGEIRVKDAERIVERHA